MIDGIIDAVSIPVMAKARIGHFVEAQVLQSLGVDYIDESEVLTPADYANHIDKWEFTVPFVCGATNLGEALRRITEGAAMIRSKGEAGTGDVSNATTHMRTIRGEIRRLSSMADDELYVAAKELQAPYELVARGRRARASCPVVLFTAGGIATPADAAMMMQLGADGVFVGSGIFKSGNPAERANAIVQATLHFDDPDVIAKVSRGLGEAMVGINVADIPAHAPPRGPRLVTPGPAHRGPRAAGRRPRAPARPGVGRRARRRRSRTPRTLEGVDALVIPGGESTTMSQAGDPFGPHGAAARRACAPGMPMYGSCAGMIMLADTDRSTAAPTRRPSAGST